MKPEDIEGLVDADDNDHIIIMNKMMTILTIVNDIIKITDSIY